MAKSPVPPEHDVALVTPPTGQITTVWWEWLQRYIQWDEACCEAGGGGGGEGGAVTEVTGTAPIVVTGSALLTGPETQAAGSVNVSMPPATGSVNGYLKATDWTIFNGKANASHTHPESDVTNLVTDLAAKAPLASPVFTGDPQAPTPSLGDADTSIATTAFVSAAVSSTFAGGMSTAEYTYSTTTTTPPSTGQLRANTTTQTAITAFYLHETNAVGIDITNALKLITTGVKVLCQDKTDASKVQYYVVTGPAVDNGVYFTIPVAWTTGGSNFTAGRVIFAGFGIGSNNMPEAPTDGQIYGRRGSDASWQVAGGGGGSYLPLAGGTLTGNLTISAPNIATLTLNDTGALSDGNASLVAWKRLATNRWAMFLDAPESSGNAGSNWAVARYSDAGSFIDLPLKITRSSGNVALAQSLSVGGNLSVALASEFLAYVKVPLAAPTDPQHVANKAYVDSLGGTGITDAPSDGGEYVRVNGVWRLKSQTVNFAGLSTIDITVPTGAKRVRWDGSLLSPSVTSQYVAARVSLDGTTFLSASTDYSYAGFAHYTGSSGFVNWAVTNQNALLVSLAQDLASFGFTMEGSLVLSRPTATGPLFGHVRAWGYASAASIQYQQFDIHHWVTTSALGSALAIKALRFYDSASLALVSGVLVLTWDY